MQATGNGASRSVRAGLAAGLALCALASSASAQQDPSLLRRALRIGNTEEVRAKASESISPHLGRVPMGGSEAAEFADPPPPCGLDVYRRFGRSVKERFQVATLGTCSISPLRVDCPTAYLPGYSRVYLVLDYRHVAAREMMVAVDAKQRAEEGRVSAGSAALSPQDRLAIGEIFDGVLEEALCGGRRGKN